MASKHSRRKAEFGDYQTPLPLARRICAVLRDRGAMPRSIVEPTCGTGSFLVAGIEAFQDVTDVVGMDVNSQHVAATESAMATLRGRRRVRLLVEDFFAARWGRLLGDLSDPLLVLGNPPWVTNADLGSIGSTNLPAKSNFQHLRGLDAITGKGNFDISEWMMIRLIELIHTRDATLAMLCKTAVARKVLLHCWTSHWQLTADTYPIDATRHFGAAADACLLVVQFSQPVRPADCRVHGELKHGPATSLFGYRDGQLLADLELYETWRHLGGKERYKWRSGIKHDCAKVMELHTEGRLYRNGLGERVDLEERYLFPLLKSSDIARDREPEPSRWMLVPQRRVGEDTSQIRELAPKTWAYLTRHSSLLDARTSSIYRRQPPFSIFGVGDYSFAQWKVAISGLYKTLRFHAVGPRNGRPAVLDDTCYFIACNEEREARLIARLLSSPPARGFFSAFVFWDAKRPVTAELLRRLDILRLAREVAAETELGEHLAAVDRQEQQLLPFA